MTENVINYFSITKGPDEIIIGSNSIPFQYQSQNGLLWIHTINTADVRYSRILVHDFRAATHILEISIR